MVTDQNACNINNFANAYANMQHWVSLSCLQQQQQKRSKTFRGGRLQSSKVLC